MKLVPFIVAAALALPGAAMADPWAGPPPGESLPMAQATEPAAPAAYGPRDPYGPPMRPGAPGMRGRNPMAAQRRAAFHAMMLRMFDRNGDGRLEPGERRQAMRALRRMERQLQRANGPRRSARAAERRAERRRVEGAIRRYDLNGDGNVDPSEMPPAAARQLRPLDRNGDGWVDGRDLR